MQDKDLPDWLWWLSLLSLPATAVMTMVTLSLVLSGVSDPRPIGRLKVDDDQSLDHGWTLLPEGGEDGISGAARNGVYIIRVEEPRTRAYATAPYTAYPPCTLEIQARQTEGPLDAGYGLWWGEAAGSPDYVVGMNSDGYLAVYL